MDMQLRVLNCQLYGYASITYFTAVHVPLSYDNTWFPNNKNSQFLFLFVPPGTVSAWSSANAIVKFNT